MRTPPASPQHEVHIEPTIHQIWTKEEMAWKKGEMDENRTLSVKEMQDLYMKNEQPPPLRDPRKKNVEMVNDEERMPPPTEEGRKAKKRTAACMDEPSGVKTIVENMGEHLKNGGPYCCTPPPRLDISTQDTLAADNEVAALTQLNYGALNEDEQKKHEKLLEERIKANYSVSDKWLKTMGMEQNRLSMKAEEDVVLKRPFPTNCQVPVSEAVVNRPNNLDLAPQAAAENVFMPLPSASTPKREDFDWGVDDALFDKAVEEMTKEIESRQPADPFEPAKVKTETIAFDHPPPPPGLGVGAPAPQPPIGSTTQTFGGTATEESSCKRSREVDTPFVQGGPRIFCVENTSGFASMQNNMKNVRSDTLSTNAFVKIREHPFFPMVKRIQSMDDFKIRHAAKRVKTLLDKSYNQHKIARAGLMYKRDITCGDILVCPFCENWEGCASALWDDCWGIHSKKCPFALMFAPYHHQPSTLENVVEKDIACPGKDASYFLSRLATFESWPQYLRFDVRKMAEDGIFYTGLSDKVSCIGGCCLLSPVRKGENLCLRMTPSCCVKKGLTL